VFVPRPWQIEATARLLDGQDLHLMAATGQGKSSIIYLPIQARPDKLALVVTPTILLQHDHYGPGSAPTAPDRLKTAPGASLSRHFS
jgi:superfamily II DNA or RNA helicase